jgi:hypothetical protein
VEIMACKDGSDEQLCHVVESSPSYQKHVVPSRLPPTIIDVYVGLLQILDISAKESKVRLKFNLSLEWFDPRLNFHGNWQEGEYNVLSPEELAALWIPEFNCSNILQKDLELLRPAEVFVYNVNNFTWTSSSLSSLYNYQVFPGKENKFRWTIKLRWARFPL